MHPPTSHVLFNAFVMNTASHNQHGQWRRPDARQVDFDDVDAWIDFAKTLEAGLFDAEVEFATMNWGQWWNTTRLHEGFGHRTPAEAEHFEAIVRQVDILTAV